MRISKPAMQAATVAASKETTRYSISSVRFEPAGPDDTGSLIATDGHRLHKLTLHDSTAHPIPEPFTLELPDLKQAVKAMGANSIATVEKPEGGRAKLHIDGAATVSAAVVDGEYPDWRFVMPKAEKATLSIGVNPQYLIDALQAAMRLNARKGDAVKLTFHDAEGLCPMTVETISAETELVAVIMPMRLS